MGNPDPLTRMRFTHAVNAVGLSLVLAACSDDVASPRPLAAGDLRASVTAEIAANLTPDGRFVLPPPAKETYTQISPERAEELALAWARTFGPFVRGHLERTHGGRIDFDALRVGAPAYYAAPVYEPVEAWVAPGLRNAFGPQYMVYLVDDEGPVLSVAIAAFNQATVENGRMRLPSAGGMEVVPDALRKGAGFVVPLSPEQAASLASRTTGARVSAVPELVMPGRGYHPQHARWRVTLDRAVAARVGSRGGGRSTREVYVGPRGELTIPSEAQPEGAPAFDPPTQRSFRLIRRVARAVSFDQVDFPFK